MRKALSKRLRFEVFKRDQFKCRYCGRNPSSGAILNVDHIIPVAKNGTNDILNLITSCFDCNSGKSDKELTDIKQTGMPDSNSLKEYKNQVTAYFDYVNTKNENLEKSVDLILSKIGHLDNYDNRNKQSIKYFLNHINLDEMLGYANLASSKTRTAYQGFKYLCGICHNVIKNRESHV